MARAPVELCDVTARDGLQSGALVWPTEDKLELIGRLVAAGVRRLEVASFVDPQRVPAMADAEAVCAGLRRGSGATDPVGDGAVRHVGLVLNERGLERAVAAGVDEVNVVVACSDTFAEANQGTTAAGSVERWGRVAAQARAVGMPAQVVLSTAFGCPYEGEVPVGRVAEVAAACAAVGPARLTLADTIGSASPADVDERVGAVLAVLPSGVSPGLHLHNSRGTAAANAWVAYGLGVRSFDASLAGIGGCPFAPGASGNVCTEDLAYLFERSGVPTGLDLDELVRASRWLTARLGQATPGQYARAGPFPRRPLR
ncbi:MAG: hydroxymethylglutaryl-CoA lyase [Acidimicrobiales bacterium]